MGPRRPARARARGARRERGRARPVLHARARQAARPPGRGGDPRPREHAACSPATSGLPPTRRRSATRTPTCWARRRCAAAQVDPELRQTPRGIVWAGEEQPGGAARRSARPSRRRFTVVDATSGAVLGLVERSRAYTTVHQGAVYLHLGESYLVRELDERTHARRRRAVRRRLVHAGEEGDRHGDRAPPARERPPRPRARLRRDRGDGAGRRLRAQDDRLAGADRARRPRAARPRRSPPRRSGSRPSPRRSHELEEMPKLLGTLHAAEHAPDRAAAALGDVRPVGHRRPLDERPPRDGPADDLHLRRPRRRDRHRRARLRPVRGLGRGHGADDRRRARATTAARRASRARSAAT